MSTNIIPEVYWLEFDTNDVSGTTLINRSTNSSTYIATIINSGSINSTEYVEGTGSLQLNNPNNSSPLNYIRLSNFIIPSSFTVSMWLNIRTKSPNVHRLWHFVNGTFWYNTGIAFFLYDTFAVNVNTNNTPEGSVPVPAPTPNPTVISGIWYNFMIVYNNGTTSYYKNNVLQGTLTNTSIPSNTTSTTHFIGTLGNETGASLYGLDGYMDDFRFYNRALSSTEMTTIYNYVKTLNYTATVSNGSFYLSKGSGSAFLNPTITFRAGFTYIFDQSDSTNTNNQIVFSRSSTGSPMLTSEDGVTVVGTPGTSGAYTRLDLSASFTGNLYYLPSAKIVTFDSILSTTGTKFYYSADSSANYTVDVNNNVTKWKNKITGGLDASANTNASANGYYPKIVTTYTGGTFKYPMIKILNTVGYNTGFDYIGGAKLSTEPNQQTIFMFGYMYGTNPNSFSLGQFLAKPGTYTGDATNGGTLHIGWDNYQNQYKIAVINCSSNEYISPNTFNNGQSTITGTNGYYMLCVTTDCSGVSGTVVNCHAYPNIDTTFNNTTLTFPNRTTDLHNWNIGYWNQTGISRSLNSAIGEVMYFNRKLTDNERYILEGNVAWKYDVSFILPSTHPYKTVAPVDTVTTSTTTTTPTTTTPTTTTPTITNFTISTKQYGAAAFTLTPPTSDSSGAFTYTSANTSVATIAGNTVTILSVGSTVITASQAASSTYNSGTITATLTVSKATPTITNFSIATKQFGDEPFTLTAPTSNSSGSFTYTSSDTSVATISSNTVTVIGGGTTTITATQAETTNYTAATITTILTVGIDPICFLRGTRITCLDEETGGDKEVEIETLRPGKFIKTYKHGYVPVNCIGYSMLPNPTNTDERVQDRLYKLTPEQYPTLTRELIITGCHAVLEDELTEEQTEKTLNILEDIYVTDDKYRLIAMIDERAEIYETEEEESEIWHLCLEHEDDKMNYGIYANGLLVESCCKCNLERVNLTVPPNPLP